MFPVANNEKIKRMIFSPPWIYFLSPGFGWLGTIFKRNSPVLRQAGMNRRGFELINYIGARQIF